jgi:branched-chain amino acid transport system ATP-binding protein
MTSQWEPGAGRYQDPVTSPLPIMPIMPPPPSTGLTGPNGLIGPAGPTGPAGLTGPTMAVGRGTGPSRAAKDPAELVLLGGRAGYGTVEVLHGLDLSIPRGRVTALLGPNGAGKTTTLRVLAGLLPLRSGMLTWGGTNITKLSAVERARAGLMLVPDERAVFPSMTVKENLRLVADIAGDPDISPALTAFPRLEERLYQRAGSMSGGERRMLALARALLAKPKVLMVDELSLGLSPRVASDLFAWLKTVADGGTTVILADQYTEEALALASVVYFLYRGERSFVGSPEEFRASPSYASS